MCAGLERIFTQRKSLWKQDDCGNRALGVIFHKKSRTSLERGALANVSEEDGIWLEIPTGTFEEFHLKLLNVNCRSPFGKG